MVDYFHTFALIEVMYGTMNEHQVAIGESTCIAKLFAPPLDLSGGDQGKALFEASEFSQIALEKLWVMSGYVVSVYSVLASYFIVQCFPV
jgi:hypothetical protein